MILKVEIILLAVFYERKNIILYVKNLKLTKNNTFNNAFCNIVSIDGCSGKCWSNRQIKNIKQ